jgi:hypothetical protein
MALIKKNTSQLQTQENDIHKALKAWYLAPGIQHDLRNKENEAVQTVLEVLERRRAAAHRTVDKRSAATKPR